MKKAGKILLVLLAAMAAWMVYELMRAPVMPDWRGLDEEDDDFDGIFDDYDL